MLTSMRRVTESFIGKAIMAVVFGLIIFAFAVWGSREDFRGLGSNKVASVGGYPIAPQEFHDAYQTMMQQYQRQRKVSPDQRPGPCDGPRHLCKPCGG